MFSSTLRAMRVRDARKQAEMFENAFERAVELASPEVITEFAASNLEVSYDFDWDLEEGAEENMEFWDDPPVHDSENGSKSGKGKEPEERIPFVYQPPHENDPADQRSDINTLLWLLAATDLGSDRNKRNTSRTEPSSSSDVFLGDAEDLEQRDTEMADMPAEPETQSGKLEGISVPETSTSGNPLEPQADIPMSDALSTTSQGDAGKKFPPGVYIEHVENVESDRGLEREEDDGSLEAAQLEGSSESAMAHNDDQQQVECPSMEKRPSAISVEFLEGIWHHYHELQEFCEWEEAHEWNRKNLRKMLREPLNNSRARHRHRSPMPYPRYGRSRSPLGVTVMTEGVEEDKQSAYAAENMKW
ncbi:hypothetical protein JMJ77_0013705 [Colletotrichum scovillei]|uniref:Uncharacterized protein n=1 Tax=Colletotrichum scovillei TaxID=1209932 RepID=A0A9P7UGQ7_9PEZI|nr:hypothetical protein JMJ77_0013705 [Colletotrichum scovillei]KAG7065220.1 hypothetical protein JMJ78_0011979 [Colletotrichum scovillei]KAG7067822.1 hypothetical protein JMJ76_0007524 [Colletotrichum scovillei]